MNKYADFMCIMTTANVVQLSLFTVNTGFKVSKNKIKIPQDSL